MARLYLPHLASLDQKLDRLFHVGIDAEPLFIIVREARAPLAAVFLASIAKKLNVSKYHANMLPEDKFNEIKELASHGGVIFVGDGVNDSPSLKEASVGIAMNSGSDIAKGAGDIVLVKNDLRGVTGLVRLANATMANIKENLFWAFMYNAICIPVAAGVFYPVFGLLLNPVYGSMAMCFSSVTVVLNALRLRYLRLKD